MVYKKYKIVKKDEELFPNLIKFELNGLVEFSNGGKQNFVFLENRLPFKNYQVGNEIEIDGNKMEVREVRKDFKNVSEDMDMDGGSQFDEGENDDGKLGSGLVSAQEQLSAYRKVVIHRIFRNTLE